MANRRAKSNTNHTRRNPVMNKRNRLALRDERLDARKADAEIIDHLLEIRCHGCPDCQPNDVDERDAPARTREQYDGPEDPDIEF